MWLKKYPRKWYANQGSNLPESKQEHVYAELINIVARTYKPNGWIIKFAFTPKLAFSPIYVKDVWSNCEYIIVEWAWIANKIGKIRNSSNRGLIKWNINLKTELWIFVVDFTLLGRKNFLTKTNTV